MCAWQRGPAAEACMVARGEVLAHLDGTQPPDVNSAGPANNNNNKKKKSMRKERKKKIRAVFFSVALLLGCFRGMDGR